MGINTLITIQDSIQEFVDGHEQLQRVVFCADDHRSSYITEDSTFPMLVVCPIDVDVKNGMNVHTLRFYVYERINDDREDVWENANDTSLILRDIRVWWNSYNQDSDIEIVQDPTGLFVSDRELDKLVGYYSDIDFEIPSHGRCDVPVSVTPVPPETCAVATYTVEYASGTLIESGTIASGATKTITVPDCPTIEDATWVLKDADGNILDTGTIASGASADITAPSATYTNTDATYSGSVLSGGSLSIPDSQINVNSVDQGDVVSVQTIDVNLSDSGGTVTPDAIVLTGNTLAITLPDGAAYGAKPLKTNQTTSYRTGDDGDLQAGRDVDFFTLNYTNPFGNTTRFTDELGGQTYANNIVIDWTTYDGATVLGVYRIPSAGNVSWAAAIDDSLALTVGSFTSGWRLWNANEMMRLMNMGATGNVYNYAPFSFPVAAFWTSTTNPLDTNNAIVNGYSGVISISSSPKIGGASRRLTVRTFTVTGTTLT